MWEEEKSRGFGDSEKYSCVRCAECGNAVIAHGGLMWPQVISTEQVRTLISFAANGRKERGEAAKIATRQHRHGPGYIRDINEDAGGQNNHDQRLELMCISTP